MAKCEFEKLSALQTAKLTSRAVKLRKQTGKRWVDKLSVESVTVRDVRADWFKIERALERDQERKAAKGLALIAELDDGAVKVTRCKPGKARGYRDLHKKGAGVFDGGWF